MIIIKEEVMPSYYIINVLFYISIAPKFVLELALMAYFFFFFFFFGIIVNK